MGYNANTDESVDQTKKQMFGEEGGRLYEFLLRCWNGWFRRVSPSL